MHVSTNNSETKKKLKWEKQSFKPVAHFLFSEKYIFEK